LKDAQSQAFQKEIHATFLKTARQSLTKGAKPDRVRFAEIPRNFKVGPIFFLQETLHNGDGNGGSYDGVINPYNKQTG